MEGTTRMCHWAALIAVIAAGVLEGIGPVQASMPGDAAIADQRMLSDPMYLPLAHQISATTSYSYAAGSLSNYFVSGGIEMLYQTLQTSTVAQTVGWGVTDDFTLRLADAFADEKSKTTLRVPGDPSEYVVSSSGATNPTLTGVYRVIDQYNRFPVSVDVIGSYSPDWLSNRVATISRHGSEGSGRQSFTTAIALGRFTPQFTIRGSVEAAYAGRGRATVVNPDDEQTTAHWDYSIGTSAQVRITDRWSIDGAYRYTIVGSETTAYSVPVEFLGRTSGGNIGDSSVGVDYHFIGNTLVAQLAYDNFQFRRRTRNFTNLPGTGVFFADDYIDNRHANEVTARLYYAF